MNGKLITVEGIEGVGKSTNIDFIQQTLESHGCTVVTTREPGGTELGESIRSVLLSKELPGMHAETELLLMFAARAEHTRRIIVPALDRGDWVVCDRFTDASYAYQGGGRGINNGRIAILEDWVLGALRPNLTLLLDVDVLTGLARARGRGAEDRFEQETLTFFERVRQRYLALAADEPERIKIIDANSDLPTVQASIATMLATYLS